MAGWAGFTDEELQRLKHKAIGQSDFDVNKAKVAHFSSQTKRNREKVFKGHSSTKQGHPKTHEKNETFNVKNESLQGKETMKVERKEEMETVSTLKDMDKVTSVSSQDQSITEKDFEKAEKTQESQHKSGSLPSEEEICDIKVLTKEETTNLELSALEQMQQKQKEIEEQNKKKKKLIKDTLQARYKRAQSETHSLQLINKDLSHLDERLAADVEILRNKIEEAAMDFFHAQKRYDKAEKEFVDAKLDLQLKREKKDDLTQHLYTIIQENEERKARKLEELMMKLNLQACDDVAVEPSTEATVPPSQSP